jgi:3-hydroxyacyl-CoA dehydrogenase
MAEAGRLGKKTGKGFYYWDSNGKHHPDPEVQKLLTPHLKNKEAFTPEQVVHRLIYPMINEATLCLEEGVVDTIEAVDAAVILGAGFPPFTGGLMRYADSVGIREIAETLHEAENHMSGRFEPSAMLKEMARKGEVFYP